MMKKRFVLLLILLLLVGCTTTSLTSNSEQSEISFSEALSSSSNNISLNSNVPEINSEVISSNSEPLALSSEEVTSSEEIVVSSSETPPSSLDPYDLLSVDGKRVVDALKKESIYANAYALRHIKVTLTYAFEYRFSYSLDSGVFEIYTQFVDNSFTLTGYVYFYWDNFKADFFGGEYEHTGGYKVTDIEFTSLYFGINFSQIDWRSASYESNVPTTEANHEKNMNSRHDKVFDALYDGLYFASEYLFDNFDPYIRLY